MLLRKNLLFAGVLLAIINPVVANVHINPICIGERQFLFNSDKRTGYLQDRHSLSQQIGHIHGKSGIFKSSFVWKRG
jgi:hypothetical protein